MKRPQSRPAILIADTNDQHVSDLKTILSADYDINVTAHGIEIIRYASSPEPPGLILIDNPLAADDDYEVCRTLKGDRTTKDIPIILLVEPSADDTVAKGFEMGAADYLTKPFKRSVVRARVRTHLELKRYRDNLETKVKERVNELQKEIQERRTVEHTYRALVEHAKDGIAIIHDFKVRFTNPAFCKMIGYTEDELMGAHLRKFISEKEYFKNTKRYSARIAGINLPRIYKSQIIHSDGSVDLHVPSWSATRPMR